MKTLILAAALLAILAVAGSMVWWKLDGQWRPKTLSKHQAEITQLLERSGWVSNHAGGRKVYVIAYRACPDWSRYHDQEVPKLQQAGAETRLILVARRDEASQTRSSPAERATVAELWVNRSLPLLEKWQATPPQAWTAAGIPPADNDAARSAVIEQGRTLIEQLQPLLKANGIDRDRMHYPTVIWQARDGRWRGCNCEDPHTWRFVRKDVGG